MRAALLLQCRDRPGSWLPSASSSPRRRRQLVEADQHSDALAGLFLQRVEFDTDRPLAELSERFAPVAARFSMSWGSTNLGRRSRLAGAGSKRGHCLGDLLVRCDLGELPATVAAVVSNHPDQQGLAERFGVPFHHLPVGDDRPAQEAAVSALLDDLGPDLVVLARYMRVLPARLVERWANG